MSGPVDKELAEAGRRDHLARRRVDRLRGHSRPHRIDRSLLRQPQHFVRRRDVGVPRFADRVRPGRVRVVALRRSARRCRPRPHRLTRSPGPTTSDAGWRRSGRCRRSRSRRRTCPSSTMAAAMSAPTSASVRPARSHSPTRACTRSIAAPALRSASTSAASLRIRSSRTIGPASTCSAPGKAARIASTCSAGVKSLTATRSGLPSRSTATAYGSSPSTQVTTSMPSSSVGTSAIPGRFELRHDQRGRAVGGDDEGGEAFERTAFAAEQVAQIGARRDQQSGTGGGLPGTLQPGTQYGGIGGRRVCGST